MPPDQTQTPKLTHDDVVQLCGDIADWKVQAIIASGGAFEDLEVAVAWEAGEHDVMGEERKPLSGAAAEIYDILISNNEFGEEEQQASS